MSQDTLLKTIEAIIDNSDLNSEDKVILSVRLAGLQLVDLNAESFSMKLGQYKISMKIEDLEDENQ